LSRALRGGCVALLLLAAAAGAEPGAAPRLLYELPAAGSYELPPIDEVSEHRLLDHAGEASPLLGLAPGQCAIVGFVYLSCTDASGCPLALASVQRLDRSLAARPDLRGRVRLVTVSFDPERDRPAELARLRHHMQPRTGWRFLTAGSASQLQPVLEDYGQDVVPRLTEDGRETGVLLHVAKVFLVDDRHRVRNVYSSGFLDHRLLLRDVETLLLAGGETGRGAQPGL
jgi:cytochrome oxidase Cu insertion factor (SCO1/SenC/PrrC family)